METITLDMLKSATSIPMVESVSDEIAKLSIRAQEVLGYSRLLHKVTPSPLCETLVSLEIETIDRKLVRDYQKQVVDDLFTKAYPSVRANSRDDDDEDDDDDDDEDPPIGGRISRGRFYWKRVVIKNYQKEVPEFVLQKAIQIKCALPQVEIFVEEVRQATDPFLVVAYNKEEYYIEVWEEPKFEGRLEVPDQKKKKGIFRD